MRIYQQHQHHITFSKFQLAGTIFVPTREKDLWNPFTDFPMVLHNKEYRKLGSIKHQVKPHIFIAWNATLHFSYPQKIEKVLNKFRPGFSNND